MMSKQKLRHDFKNYIYIPVNMEIYSVLLTAEVLISTKVLQFDNMAKTLPRKKILKIKIYYVDIYKFKGKVIQIQNNGVEIC